MSRTISHIKIAVPPVHEIIVSDGGSTDNTLEIARHHQCKLILNEKKGRSLQMNKGAKTAEGDILCFVHGDTFVPSDFTDLILQTMADKKNACGGFKVVMSEKNKTYWSISFHHFMKTHYGIFLRPHLYFRGMRTLFGDQAIFCRKKDFFQVGMFDENLPITEDIDLCKKLCTVGKTIIIDRIVETSGRRIAKWGYWRTVWIYYSIGILSQLGISVSFLKKFYPENDHMKKTKQK